ncbi:GrpB family protein [Oceanobacillus timonensis]
MERHLIFRDYLRIHKGEAIKYNVFKEQLAQKYQNTNEYSKKKEVV